MLEACLIALIFSNRAPAGDHSTGIFEDDVVSHTLEVIDPATGNRVGLMGDGAVIESQDADGKKKIVAYTGASSRSPEIGIRPTGGNRFPIPLEEIVFTFQLLDDGNWYTWTGAVPIRAEDPLAPELARRNLHR